VAANIFCSLSDVYYHYMNLMCLLHSQTTRLHRACSWRAHCDHWLLGTRWPWRPF